MRAALNVLAGLALATSLTACGGSDGGSGASAPDDASTSDFCDGFNGLFEKVLAQAASGDSSAMITALKDWAGDMEDIGTPSDMPDDARRGFELFIDQAKDLDEDATLDDLQNLGDDLSDDDQADGDAFSTWTTDNCALDIPGVDASDLPSIDPSDLASDLENIDPEDMESMMSELEEQMGSLTESP
ncbi:hypothetical protein [Nocardioides sp. T2.26MG-1]|uniref:hypothetical protein n=1 Tax=Nocardioides sp. T2.26MG-1 TaxID=3041166 RepID=UPI0024774328|nr:hypothetical protein [Nocardioides sp. T2.26MG-1]CAI9402127.1 hypothetical protein HIDPHFAB_00751 [Nocardioides sp. T2.26MG-1]